MKAGSFIDLSGNKEQRLLLFLTKPFAKLQPNISLEASIGENVDKNWKDESSVPSYGAKKTDRVLLKPSEKCSFPVFGLLKNEAFSSELSRSTKQSLRLQI